jgi:Toprim-like
MIDTTRLLETIDCREIVEADLGQAKYRGPSAHSWPCGLPDHKEQHGFSLTAWKDGWKCWGKCATGGTAIDWLMKFHLVDFKEACRMLGAAVAPTITRSGTHRHIHAYGQHNPIKALATPPAADWQKSARAIVEETETTLRSPVGERALRYLFNRGLNEEIIGTAHLGYLPGQPTQWVKLQGLSVPCGVTIPTFADDHLWGIKTRRAAGEPKYSQVAGGNLAGSMYCADRAVPARPMLIVEGEFDCLIIAQDAGDLVNPVTVGSASNNINPRWFALMACCSAIYGCYDPDGAGKDAATRLAKLSDRIKIIRVPQGKDPTEFHLKAGSGAVRAWIGGLFSSPVPSPVEPAPRRDDPPGRDARTRIDTCAAYEANPPRGYVGTNRHEGAWRGV